MSGSPLDDVPLDAWMDPAEFSRNLERLVDALPEVEPSSQILFRVLGTTRGTIQLRRFAGHVSRLLDVSLDAARTLLDRAVDRTVYSPGLVPSVWLLHAQGGPAVANAITEFVRLEAGTDFPHHQHLGEETVLILQGHLREGDRTAGPGDLLTKPPGSSHAFTALPGPDLVYLAVVRAGLRVGDKVLTADDPRG